VHVYVTLCDFQLFQEEHRLKSLSHTLYYERRKEESHNSHFDCRRRCRISGEKLLSIVRHAVLERTSTPICADTRGKKSDCYLTHRLNVA